MSITRVTRLRWDQAQAAEQSHWMAALRPGPAQWKEDWNQWWAEKFDGYPFLPLVAENICELGCGPFTNVRVLLDNRWLKAEHVHCSDPLAQFYLLTECWLTDAVHRGRVLLDDHPAEVCPYADDYFDIVLMINVLDHVRNAFQVLRQAQRIVRPGGVLVIGQDCSNEQDEMRAKDDLLHPIQLLVSDVVVPGLDVIFSKTLSREEGRNPAAHYATLLWAGRKPPRKES